MFKQIPLIKVIVFFFLSSALFNQYSFATTKHFFTPQKIGKPSLKYRTLETVADSYTLTADGKKLYLLKRGKLYIFQVSPFKPLRTIDFPFNKSVKEESLHYRIWVTSDERFLNLAVKDKVILFDLQTAKIIKTLVLEHQEFLKSTFFNDELLLFCRDTFPRNHKEYKGSGHTTIKVFDAYSLSFIKDLNYLLGKKFKNSVADAISQIDDKFFWYQPYGFGVYGQNTAWLRVIDSHSYQEELRSLQPGRAYLRRDAPVLYLPYVSEIIDFLKPNDLQVTRFDEKAILFDLNTRHISELTEEFYRRLHTSFSRRNAFDRGFLLLTTSRPYLKNKDVIVGPAPGALLGIYNVKTETFMKLSINAEGETVLIDQETGEFIASPGARKYLYFKHAEDKYLPITDEEYQQFSKSQVDKIKE